MVKCNRWSNLLAALLRSLPQLVGAVPPDLREREWMREGEREWMREREREWMRERMGGGERMDLGERLDARERMEGGT